METLKMDVKLPMEVNSSVCTPSKVSRKFGSSVTPLSPHTFETMKSHLRYLFGEGKHHQLRFLCSEMEKKTAELEVAKCAVKMLQREVKATGAEENTESEEDKEFEKKTISNVELTQKFKRQLAKLSATDNCSGSDLETPVEPHAGEKYVAQLEDEIERLTTDLKKSNFSSEIQQQAASKMEKKLNAVLRDMETALEESNNKIIKLEMDIEVRKTNYAFVNADLQLKKNTCSQKEAELAECKKMKNEAIQKLEVALEEAAVVEKHITKLASVVDKEKKVSIEDQLETAIKQEQFLRQKCESRFESINNGVQNIIKDFHAVKADLITTRTKNSELQDQLKASKEDAKYYKTDAENCRKYSRKLEAEVVKSLKEGQAETFVAQKNFDKLKSQLENTQKLMDTTNPAGERIKQLECELNAVKKEFEMEISTGEQNSVLSAIKSLKEKYQLVQQNGTFEMDAHASKKEAWDKLTSQNAELEKEVKRLEMECEQASRTFSKEAEDAKIKLEEDVVAMKGLIKKIRKERDSYAKKLKRKEESSKAEKETDGDDDIANQSLDASSFANTSILSSNDSLVSCRSSGGSDSSDKLVKDQLEADLNDLRKEHKDLLAKFSKLKSQLDTTEKDKVEQISFYQKTLRQLESRFWEVQRSTVTLQKRFDDEALAARTKLEASENALSVQQELNAQKNISTEELHQKYGTELKELAEKYQSLKDNSTSDSGNTTIELNEARKQIEHLEKHREDLRKQIADLTLSHETVQHLTKQKLNEVEKSLVTEKNVSGKLRTRVQKLEIENVQLKGYESLLNAEKEKFASFDNELTVRNEQITQLLRVQKELNAMNEKLDSEATLRSDKINYLEQTVAHKETTIKESAKQIANLEEKLENIVKQSVSPDRLEKRLEVVQNSAKARCKRFEEDLEKARDELKVSIEEREKLSEQNAYLSARAEEFSIDQQNMSDELIKSIEREQEAKQKAVFMENLAAANENNHKKERAGLIEELVDAKQKMDEFRTEQAAELKQIKALEERLNAAELKAESHSASPAPVDTSDQFDKVLPWLDPATRQFLRLLSKNHNLAYGLYGFAVYTLLIHLYILL